MREHLTELQTESITAERIWTVDDIPVLTAATSLPQPSQVHGHVSRRIRRYYQAQGQAFFHYCQHILLPLAKAEYQTALAASAPLPCFHAELYYQITWNENGLWSLYTESQERIGSSPTLRIRHGDTWDLSTGYPVTLSSRFQPKVRWKKVILTAVAAEIEQQERCGIAQYHVNWRHLLRRRLNSRNFFLTSEGLAFFYPMYAIAPTAEGIPTFVLKYDALLLQDPASEP